MERVPHSTVLRVAKAAAERASAGSTDDERSAGSSDEEELRRPGRATKLPAAEEKRLVAWIEHLQAAHLPPTREQIMEQAAALAKALVPPRQFQTKDGLPSDKWYLKFRARWPQLRTSGAESVQFAKVVTLGDAEAMVSLAATLQPLIQQLGLTAANIFNFDESPISQRSTNKNRVKVVTSSNVPLDRIKIAVQDSFSGHVSVCATVSAAGDVLLPLAITTAATVEPKQLQDVPGGVEIYHTGTRATRENLFVARSQRCLRAWRVRSQRFDDAGAVLLVSEEAGGRVGGEAVVASGPAGG
jgi:hypothetical protein